MPINHLKFINKMINKFIRLYPNLSINLIVDIIEEVLIKAPDNYFSYNMVQEHPELCKQCGQCCKNINFKCEHFNGRTCDEYATRYDACAEWPYYHIDTGDFDSGLWLDPHCAMALGLASLRINEKLKEYSDMYEMS